MTTTTININELLKKSLNPYFLDDFFGRSKRELETIIIPKSKRKIRTQDVGKAKQFKKLLDLYQGLHERKKKEKDDFIQALKAKSQKRPDLNATKTMRFARFLQN